MFVVKYVPIDKSTVAAVFDDGKVVTKSTTDGCIFYRAWEPFDDDGKHLVVVDMFGRRYGEIASRTCPPEIEQNFNPDIFMHWMDQKHDKAYRMIITAFPEASSGNRFYGHIYQYV